MSRIICVFPTRGRPELFKRRIENINSRLSGKHEFIILVTFDTDDLSMNNLEMIEYLTSIPNVKFQDGISRSKIHAINRGMDIAPKEFDIVILMADDFDIQEYGFDDIIVSNIDITREHILNFSDGRRSDKLITFPVMTKKLYDYFGYIYHPDFRSEWCDNLQTDICRNRGWETYIPLCISKHEWVSCTGKDAVFLHNQKFISADKNLYLEMVEKGLNK